MNRPFRLIQNRLEQMPWVKGQSGNAGGRPKVAGVVKEAAQAYGLEAIERLAELMRSDNPAVVVKAAQVLLDRGFGKPEQAVEMTGADGAPLLSGIAVRLVKADGSSG